MAGPQTPPRSQAETADPRFAVSAVLFDLDGTLIHTAPDLARAINLMLSRLELPTEPEQRIMDWMGSGAMSLIKRALTKEVDGEPQADLFDRAHALFHEYYLANVAAHSRPYPDVVEALRSLKERGLRVACVTNKPQVFTEPLLEELDLSALFDMVISGDSLPRKKPDPLQLHHVCRHLGVAEHDAVLVGDSINDVNAAKAAGMPVICVSYGYSQGIDLTKHAPDAIIDSFTELLGLVHSSRRMGT